MTFDEAYAYLLALPRFAKYGTLALKPGFERIEALMEAMGQPDTALESVLIAGTNGKGSTASMLAAIASATGRRVGLHTSPHLFRITERMRVNGMPAPTDWLAKTVARFRSPMDAIQPSFFEATLALSLRYFADEAVDLAVVEVGLGGRLDATNILRPRLSVITHIGFDHMGFLGNSLQDIAREKAGIIEPDVPVLSGIERPEIRAVIAEEAQRHGAELHEAAFEVTVTPGQTGTGLTMATPLRAYQNLNIDLPGHHQQRNARVALRAAEIIFPALNRDAVSEGLGQVRRRTGLRGRLEVLQKAPLVIADVAHNMDGLAAVRAYVDARTNGRRYALFGMMRDKDLPAMAASLSGMTVFPVCIPAERALSVAELAVGLQEAGVSVVTGGPISDGLGWFFAQARPEDVLVVTGSHQVVAEIPVKFWPNLINPKMPENYGSKGDI